jgi:hypothetical protein
MLRHRRLGSLRYIALYCATYALAAAQASGSLLGMMSDETDAAKSHLVSGFHTRNTLPHIKREGGAYFVTFRLAGTLVHPRSACLEL